MTKTMWSPAENDWVYTHSSYPLNADTYSLFCKEFGEERSFDSFCSKIRRVRRRMGLYGAPEASEAPLLGPREWALQALSEARKLKPKKLKNSRTKKPTSVWMLSDLHSGALTDDFCFREFKARVLSMPEIHYRRGHLDKLEKIIVMLAGDIVEGEGIFKGQGWRIEAPAIDQVMHAFEVLWELLVVLSTYAPVEVHTVPGNHGRTGIKGENHPTSNWDNVVYSLLAVKAENEKRIDFKLNWHDWVHVPVQQTSGLLNHQGAKHASTPTMQNKYTAWEKRFGFDWVFNGHHHRLRMDQWHDKTVFGNGSLVGHNDHSDDNGWYETARQGYFFVQGKDVFNFSWCEFE